MSKNLVLATIINEHGAAEYLNISVKTLQKWRGTGDGPRFAKLGAAVRYRLADLEQFLDASLRKSTSDHG